MSHKGNLYAIQHQTIHCAVCGKEFTVNAGHEHPVCSNECSTAYRYAEHFPHLKQLAYEYEWLGWGLRTLARKYNISTKKVSRLLHYTGYLQSSGVLQANRLSGIQKALRRGQMMAAAALMRDAGAVIGEAEREQQSTAVELKLTVGPPPEPLPGPSEQKTIDVTPTDEEPRRKQLDMFDES